MLERRTVTPSIAPVRTRRLLWREPRIPDKHKFAFSLSLSFEDRWWRASFILSFPFPFVGRVLSGCMSWISAAACIDINNDTIHYRVQVFNKSYSAPMSLCWSWAANGATLWPNMAERVFAQCVLLPVPLAVQPGSARLSPASHGNPVHLREAAAAAFGVPIPFRPSAVTTTNLLCDKQIQSLQTVKLLEACGVVPQLSFHRFLCRVCRFCRAKLWINVNQVSGNATSWASEFSA